MRQDFLQTIHIKLMPSMLLLGLLLAISIVACAIIVSLTVALYIKLLIIALILLTSAYFILRDALLLLPNSWKIIDVDNKGELTMTNKSGQQFQPVLASSSFTHAACTILNFKREDLIFALPPAILLLKNDDEVRLLRVWLRWFKHDKTGHQEDLSADLAA
jgi:tellurite resistance protein TehA-like permease